VKTCRYPQNRKYITYRNAARWGSSTATVKLCRNVMRNWRYTNIVPRDRPWLKWRRWKDSWRSSVWEPRACCTAETARRSCLLSFHCNHQPTHKRSRSIRFNFTQPKKNSDLRSQSLITSDCIRFLAITDHVTCSESHVVGRNSVSVIDREPDTDSYKSGRATTWIKMKLNYRTSHRSCVFLPFFVSVFDLLVYDVCLM